MLLQVWAKRRSRERARESESKRERRRKLPRPPMAFVWATSVFTVVLGHQPLNVKLRATSLRIGKFVQLIKIAPCLSNLNHVFQFIFL
jgi:hypothetical protein